MLALLAAHKVNATHVPVALYRRAMETAQQSALAQDGACWHGSVRHSRMREFILAGPQPPHYARAAALLCHTRGLRRIFPANRPRWNDQSRSSAYAQAAGECSRTANCGSNLNGSARFEPGSRCRANRQNGLVTPNDPTAIRCGKLPPFRPTTPRLRLSSGCCSGPQSPPILVRGPPPFAPRPRRVCAEYS